MLLLSSEQTKMQREKRKQGPAQGKAMVRTAQQDKSVACVDSGRVSARRETEPRISKQGKKSEVLVPIPDEKFEAHHVSQRDNKEERRKQEPESLEGFRDQQTRSEI